MKSRGSESAGEAGLKPNVGNVQSHYDRSNEFCPDSFIEPYRSWNRGTSERHGGPP
jgi:hypothetical protein